MYDLIGIIALSFLVLLIISKLCTNKHIDIPIHTLVTYPDGTLGDEVNLTEFPMYINNYKIDVVDEEIVVYKYSNDGYKRLTNIIQCMNLLKKYNI